MTDPPDPTDPPDAVDLADADPELAALLDDDTRITRPHRGAFRVIGAVLLVALLVLLVLVPGGWLVRQATGSGGGSSLPTDAQPTSATLAERPPGAIVTDADWRTQIGAAVLIGPGAPLCSGAVTSIDGRRYVTSARHCLDDVLEKGVVSPEPGAAQEVTGRLAQAMQVYDPSSHARIATLDRIAVGTGDDDVLVATTRAETSAFRAKVARELSGSPSVGDEVATYASSGAEGFKPVRLTGVFLGDYSFHDPGGHAYTVDLIGYRQAASAVLVGRGHSGTSPTGAGGTTFGPLLFSLNRDTSPAERTSSLRQMSDATGLDLASEGLVGVDETLHLTAPDYQRFDAVLRASP
jgi:hypothetical protein